MSWTTPHTYATGDIVTAANMNETRDNLTDLDRRTSPVSATVTTSQTRNNAAFGDLTTTGPAVTVTIGATGKAQVTVYSAITNDTINGPSAMGFAASGATTIAASDAYSLVYAPSTAAVVGRYGATWIFSGLNSGSTTFTAKYKTNGSCTGTWNDRYIAVTPLGS